MDNTFDLYYIYNVYNDKFQCFNFGGSFKKLEYIFIH